MLKRGRAVVARLPHKQKAAGSIPAPATNRCKVLWPHPCPGSMEAWFDSKYADHFVHVRNRAHAQKEHMAKFITPNGSGRNGTLPHITHLDIGRNQLERRSDGLAANGIPTPVEPTGLASEIQHNLHRPAAPLTAPQPEEAEE